ncbi:preprotein translocase subunit YajC [Metallumcola ferriviriculae]|uniref:Preprotein translocase subunit YajC n=1 Tax=Metallumcola ferriviriculae TaxID=3039180 RepID=A0AAU0USG9_9FIRM|nr:preprotein translocase subunit YajC [Desulfitibacteraceae bacterium MK1]
MNLQGIGGTVAYFGLFIAILYFLMIRPQQKQQKKRQEMLGKLEINDKVVTVGGLHGKLIKMDDDTIVLRIADKVEVKFDKKSIAYVASDN